MTLTRMLTAVIIVVAVVIVAAAGPSSSIGGVGGKAGGGAGGLHAIDIASVDLGNVSGVVEGVRNNSLGGGGEAAHSWSDRSVKLYWTGSLQRLGVSAHNLAREKASAESDNGDGGGGADGASVQTTVGDSLGCHVHAAGAGRVVVAVVLRIARVGVLSESWGSDGAEEEEALGHLHLDGLMVVGLMGCESNSRASEGLGWWMRLCDGF